MDLDKEIYETIVYENDVYYEEVNKGMEYVKELVKKNGYVLYGGMAIDMALKKSGNKGIYPEDALPDYDFIVTDSVNVGNQLGLDLHRMGLPYISVINAMHSSTRKTRVYFQTVADITYVPPNIYEGLPTLEYDGFKITHPYFQFVHMHYSFCYPYSGFPREVYLNRARKDSTRYHLLYKAYPIVADISYSERVKKYTMPALKDVCYGGFIAYAHYYDQLSTISKKMKVEMPEVIKCTISGKFINIPKDYDNLFRYDIISNTPEDDMKKISTDYKCYTSYIDTIPARAIFDKYVVYDNSGRRLLSNHWDKNYMITNIQWTAMIFLFYYFFDKDSRYLQLYLSCKNLKDHAEDLYELMKKENEKTAIQFAMSSPYFMNGEYYGDEIISHSNKEREKIMRYVVFGERFERNTPKNYYPEQAEDWDQYDYSKLGINSEEIPNL